MYVIRNESQKARPSAALPFHPCIHPAAHRQLARIHLPVAAKCNITCRFCARHIASCRNNLPGTSRKVMNPEEAMRHLHRQRKIWGKDAVVGISGPGDPLANPETFAVLQQVKTEFPSHPLCLCTNGLLLKEKAQDLYDLGVRVLSITINGVDPKIVKHLQSGITFGKIALMGEAAARRLIEAQLSGLLAAVEKGMFIKVNTIVATGINDNNLTILAKTLADAGAGIMNIVPVIPPNAKSPLVPPDSLTINRLRSKCESYIPQFMLCRQCRSDAAGIPGKTVKGGCCS